MKKKDLNSLRQKIKPSDFEKSLENTFNECVQTPASSSCPSGKKIIAEQEFRYAGWDVPAPQKEIHIMTQEEVTLYGMWEEIASRVGFDANGLKVQDLIREFVKLKIEEALNK